MFKKIFTTTLAFCLAICIVAQPGNMYKDIVYRKVSFQKNIQYADNIPVDVKRRYYLFDLYQATEDTTTKRPLIIWMHGGGFKFGSKAAKGPRIWSKTFARRGYVSAAVNYRLSKKNTLRNFPALVKACYDAVHDIQQCVAFFKKNYAEYRIDTNRIILAGNSAGAIIALQSVFSSEKDFTLLLNVQDSASDLSYYNPHNIAVVVNFWGALFNTNWLNNTRVPIVSVHGKKDRIVPYGRKDSPMFGSGLIHEKANSLGIPNRLKTYSQYGHELQRHFNPILRSRATRRRWLEAGQFAADFLVEQLWR